MKLTIIGGGNMGGSIVRGLAKGTIFKASDITVIDVRKEPLDIIKSIDPEITTVLNDYRHLAKADIVMLAVKPWMVQDALLDIKFTLDYSRQIVVSIAGGVTIKGINENLNKASDENSLPTVFRVIPNTAIAVGESMTLIASENASSEQQELLLKMFNEVGHAVLIDEDQMEAGTALASCGIAYLFRYVRAATLAGVEMGFYPQQAQELIAYTMQGAAALLLHTKANPEQEIDKVTTPGGLTIKGLNELEANGFSSAIIKAMKVSR